jgi:large subunit ribosomal protein L35
MKLKTSKSAKKRFRITSTGKVRRRAVNVNHFNAKDSGNERRRKRPSKGLNKSLEGNILGLFPYGLIV